MLVEMALKRIAENNNIPEMEVKHDIPKYSEADTSASSIGATSNVDINNNSDDYCDETDFADFDDDVIDPDWTIKRKRDHETSLDSEFDSEDETLNTECMKLVPNNEEQPIENCSVVTTESDIIVENDESVGNEVEENRGESEFPFPDTIEHEETIERDEEVNPGEIKTGFHHNKKQRMQGKKYAGMGKARDGK